MDEFEIQAIGHPTDLDRKWTRSKLGASKSIVDRAVDELGYSKAWVVNTYGGHVSDTLYVRTASVMRA